MAISRFNRRQGVQFNPMSFEEISAAPLAMQKRYDVTQENATQASDVLSTVENTGDADADAATKQYRDQLNAFTDNMSKNGYTPGMVDDFNKIRRGFTSTINNISAWKQAAAKQAQFESQQDQIGSNIKAGQSDLSYNSYLNDRDNFGKGVKYFDSNDMFKIGATAGSGIANEVSNGRAEKIPNLAGYINYIQDPKYNTTEALNHYLDNEGSKLVDSLIIAKTGDKNLLNNDMMRASVRAGILSSGIGKQKSQILSDKNWAAAQEANRQAAQNNASSEIRVSSLSAEQDIRKARHIKNDAKTMESHWDGNGNFKLNESNVERASKPSLEKLTQEFMNKGISRKGAEHRAKTIFGLAASAGSVGMGTTGTSNVNLSDTPGENALKTYNKYKSDYDNLWSAYENGTLEIPNKIIGNDKEMMDFVMGLEADKTAKLSSAYYMSNDVTKSMVNKNAKFIELKDGDNYQNVTTLSTAEDKDLLTAAEAAKKSNVTADQFKNNQSRITPRGDIIMSVGDKEYVVLPNVYDVKNNPVQSGFNSVLDSYYDYSLSTEKINEINSRYEGNNSNATIRLYIDPKNPIKRIIYEHKADGMDYPRSVNDVYSAISKRHEQILKQ